MLGDPTSEFVRDALSGDAVKAQETFNQMMRDKISARVEALRQTTAASLFADEESEDTSDAGSETVDD